MIITCMCIFIVVYIRVIHNFLEKPLFIYILLLLPFFLFRLEAFDFYTIIFRQFFSILRQRLYHFFLGFCSLYIAADSIWKIVYFRHPIQFRISYQYTTCNEFCHRPKILVSNDFWPKLCMNLLTKEVVHCTKKHIYCVKIFQILHP